jgi:tellurite resistance protein TerC
MIGGASWAWWIGFHIAVIALLAVDSLLPGNHRESQRSQAVAWLWTVALALCAAAFAGWIAIAQGRETALQFVAGYTIETSLSIDNLFVFLVLFQGFRISPQRQHTALMWGVAGAVVLRALFIAAGVTLLQRFDWITYVFGLFLLYAAFRLIRGGSARAAIPDWIRRLQPSKGSLLPVILAVEFTDLLFAVDSIPAVLAVSHHPFVVYTSNIAAILGLRSLYFALASLLDRFHYLHYGLGALLGFVALKMLAAKWFELPITYSLAIMGAILAICAVASLLVKGREHKPEKSEHTTGVEES